MNIHILTAEIEQLKAQNKKLREELEKERMANRNLRNREANPKKSK